MINENRYWDASCFLGWLKEESDKVKECHGVIKAAENNDIKIFTSAFTLVEVLYLKHNNPIPKEDAEKVKSFFENDFIRTVAVDREIAKTAQDLVWDYKIKPKDAIHVATALYMEIKIIDTFDQNLINKFDNKIGNPPIKINRPHYIYQLSFGE